MKQIPKQIPLLLAIPLFLFLPAARGQVGLYASFSASQLNSPDTSWFYGSTLGGYYDGAHFPVINLGVDARVSLLSGSHQPTVDSGMIGPRVVLHIPFAPLKIYGEGLAGAGHVVTGQGITYTDATHLQYGVVGGADVPILPRVDWRVIDYEYSWLEGVYGGTSQATISSGLVLRLPVP